MQHFVGVPPSVLWRGGNCFDRLWSLAGQQCSGHSLMRNLTALSTFQGSLISS